MNALYQQSVMRVRAPLVTDRYGNEIRDWSSADRTEVTGINVQPASVNNSTETTGDRSAVDTAWKIITPRGRDLDALPSDRFEYEGMTLEVMGEVARFWLGGRVHHVEITLRRVTG